MTNFVYADKSYRNVREFVDSIDLTTLTLAWMDGKLDSFPSIVANRFAREGKSKKLRKMVHLDLDKDRLAYNAGLSGDKKTINVAMYYCMKTVVDYMDNKLIFDVDTQWKDYLYIFNCEVIKGAIVAGHERLWLNLFDSLDQFDAEVLGYGAAVTDDVDLMKLACENDFSSDIADKLENKMRAYTADPEHFYQTAYKHNSKNVLAYIEKNHGEVDPFEKGVAMLMKGDLSGIDLLEEYDLPAALISVAREGNYDTTNVLLEKGAKAFDRTVLVKELMKEGYTDVAALFK